MRSIVSLVSALVLLVGMAPAKADDVATCDKGPWEEKIAACSRVISSGKFKGHSLAVVFNSRGNVYQGKADYDRAIADFSEAIRLDPKYATAYSDRGRSYQLKGDYDRAIADFTEAIRLDQKHTFAYIDRGNSYRMKGDYDRAIADHSDAIRLAEVSGLSL